MSATVKHIPGNSSTSLNRYLETDKEEQRSPRILFEHGQHCRPATAAQEMRALRQLHGRAGEMRRAPGRYVTPEDPSLATHLKVGKNWREARSGEKATHQRIEPPQPFVKPAETHHFIYSFDLESVNPEDPEQTRAAFDAVVAFRAQYSPGTQSRFVAQNDGAGSRAARAAGESGKFHVHEAMNAVVARDMEVEGRDFRAGQRVGGPVTHVDTYRRAWDQFLAERGREFGLAPQDRSKLPEVGSEAYRAVRRTDQDHWERERGSLSDADRARRGMEQAYAALAEDPAALKGRSDSDRLLALADAVHETGDVELRLRTTKAGETKLRSYVAPGRTQGIGHARMGERYSAAGVTAQLEAIAQGTWKPLPTPSRGEPRPITELTDSEVDEAELEVAAAARQELAEQRREQAETERAARATQELAEAGREPEFVPRRWHAKAETRAGAPAVKRDEKPDAPPAPPAPLPPLQLRALRGDPAASHELLAIVRSERAGGGAYVDFALAADDPAARGEPGLHLRARRETVTERGTGRQREVTRTWQQLTEREYAALRAAAGDNSVAGPDGATTLAVRGAVRRSPRTGDGYVAAQLEPSARRLDGAVLARQRASQETARAGGQERRDRTPAMTPAERAFAAATRATETTDHDRGLG